MKTSIKRTHQKRKPRVRYALLNQQRILKGMTMFDVSLKAKIPYMTAWNILHGISQHPAMVKKICQVLDVPVETVYGLSVGRKS